MNRSISQSLRLPVALAAAATLAACGGTVDFDVSRSFDVNTGTGTTWTGTQAVDLSTDSSAAWKQRKHIDTIEVVSADATITVIGAGNVATTGSGSAAFRPDGATNASQDVSVGTWTNVPLTVGSTIALTPSAELDTFLTDVLKGSGKFSVVASGTADAAPAIFTVKVSVGAKLKWKPF